MTIQEAIAKVDSLKPNQYKQPEKLEWLNEVDGKIYKELILTHDNPDELSWESYGVNTDVSMELLAKEPYATLYIHYLSAKIDWYNGEYGRYNNEMAAYNEAYQEYANYICRTYGSVGVKRIRL